MTKKHFDLLAREIRDRDNPVGFVPITYDQRLFAADVVIVVAEKTNSRFNRFQFLKACGLNPVRTESTV